MEGRGRFERRFNPEDPYQKGIEASGKYGIEGNTEKEAYFWLSTLLDPRKIAEAKSYPASAEWSTERCILELMIGVLVESGPELNPDIKKRLKNLIGIFRIVAFLNMKPTEQEFLNRWAQSVKAGQFEYLLTPETIEDIEWIWRIFNLSVPEQSAVEKYPLDIQLLYLHLEQ